MFSTRKEISVGKMDSILETFSVSGTLELEHYDLLIYGGGGQSRSYYNKLRQDIEVEILWTGWCGSPWTSFLSFIPGQAGLVKVRKQRRLKPLFEDLAALSVSDLYYVPRELTGKIRSVVSKRPSSHNPKKLLENEKSFFYLQAEMDETIHKNGEEYYLFDIAIGPELPEDFKILFQILDVK